MMCEKCDEEWCPHTAAMCSRTRAKIEEALRHMKDYHQDRCDTCEYQKQPYGYDCNNMCLIRTQEILEEVSDGAV